MSLLGLDLGTTGCKAAVFALDGRRLAQAYREYETLRPEPGRAELDAADVWAKTRECIAEVAAASEADPPAALSISSMGEALVPLTRDRRILGRAVLCTDARGAEYVERLREEIGQERFYQINPNLLGPQYSLPKLLWIRENQSELYRSADRFLLWADAVAFLLGCEPVASQSLANRTLLFDLGAGDWSETLLEWSGIERGKLGRVVPGGRVLGEVAPHLARELGLPPGVRVVSGGHDQCLNALGCGAAQAGRAVCGIGTFECITPVFGPIAEPLSMLEAGLSIEHHVLPGLFVSFLYNQGAALVKWFRDTFAAADTPPAGADIYDVLNREMPPEPTNLLVLPHFETPVCPRTLEDSAGVIAGLRTETTRGEILKAVMEGETFYFAELMDTLGRLGIRPREFIASGGGARSDAWLQIKADVFGLPFVRPRITEASTLGAAMLAGLATGAFASPGEAASRFVARECTFEPDARRHELYHERLAIYRALYPAVRGVTGALRGRKPAFRTEGGSKGD
jgi:xylulokinase